MNKIYRYRIIVFIPIFLLLIILLVFIPYKDSLVLYDQHTKRVLAYLPFTDQKNFQIMYTHSIHLSDVVESYKISNDQKIIQYELMYEDFAIGMPSNAEAGEKFLQKDGKYYIKNMQRVFPYFDLRTGKVRANHRLLYKQRVYPMSNFVEPGTLIRIKPDKLSLIQQMKGVNILGTK
ncbi:DUF1850 domain-containing protein [Calidifontibacillus oryziterrae]|uniref:DUF1850 domain-containing protein n=1 Tax=Calidifontibacillus oryziterrae TaxID=1191699 RepID=UPI000302CA35|nr:DUF1850 domain-containing protein [Calidifontibacillus oryziterrae]